MNYDFFFFSVVDDNGQLWQLEAVLLKPETYLDKCSPAPSCSSQALSQKLQSLRSTINYLQKNWRRLGLLSLWMVILTALVTWKFYQYMNKDGFKVMGYCLLTAKGAAETLKFNMALILLPVCRNTITWLRSTKLAYLIPFDDNINFHKVHTHTHIYIYSRLT